MVKLAKKTRKVNDWWGRKRHRRYGSVIFYRASRKVSCYKRYDDVFELSGCCLKTCLFPMLTCNKCHMEFQ